MFTGIVTDIGRVRRVVPPKGPKGRRPKERRTDTRIEIDTSYSMAGVPIGASISCAGCCLTVIEKGRGWFAVEASSETLSKTTLGDWKNGGPVNLERALRAGDELGGHIVSGHVDDFGRIVARRAEGGSTRFAVAVARELGKFIAPKGSITIDGVSLTVNEVADKGGTTRFGVNVIAHTAKVTTLGALKAGDRVNVEIDMLARYGARLAEAGGKRKRGR